ncbi:MAG: GAP family protein [Allobranchiibius sp.]
MGYLGGLLTFVLPLAVLAAISPIVFLNASTVATNYGASGVRRFLAGNAIVLILIGVPSLGLLGDAAASFTRRELASQVVDGILGLVLLAYGGWLWRSRTRTARATTSENDQASEAARRGLIAWGALGMATNFTTLPLYLSICGHIGASRLNVFWQAIVLAGAVAVVLTPAWIPLLLLRIAPTHTRVSERSRARVAAGTRIASIAACVIGGAVLVGHAVLN